MKNLQDIADTNSVDTIYNAIAILKNVFWIRRVT